MRTPRNTFYARSSRSLRLPRRRATRARGVAMQFLESAASALNKVDALAAEVIPPRRPGVDDEAGEDVLETDPGAVSTASTVEALASRLGLGRGDAGEGRDGGAAKRPGEDARGPRDGSGADPLVTSQRVKLAGLLETLRAAESDAAEAKAARDDALASAAEARARREREASDASEHIEGIEREIEAERTALEAIETESGRRERDPAPRTATPRRLTPRSPRLRRSRRAVRRTRRRARRARVSWRLRRTRARRRRRRGKESGKERPPSPPSRRRRLPPLGAPRRIDSATRSRRPSSSSRRLKRVRRRLGPSVGRARRPRRRRRPRARPARRTPPRAPPSSSGVFAAFRNGSRRKRWRRRRSPSSEASSSASSPRRSWNAGDGSAKGEPRATRTTKKKTIRRARNDSRRAV